MKRFWVILAAFLTLSNGRPGSAFAQDRPNLVLIIADDMGWEDCGAYGNKGIRTPNLDRLSREGMRFDRAILTCSSCSPSRASIITGRYPHNTGAHQLHLPLPKAQVTFVEKLKASGYWTAQAGKWHLGNQILDRFDVVKQKGGKSGCDNWLETLKERPADKPFFLWLAAVDPHRPYEPNSIPNPHQPEDVTVPPYLPDVPATRRDLALYYDEITRMDGYIGQVLDELDRQNLSQNTLVLFMTDNGRPFPRAKTTLYDSGIKSPFLLRWPAKVKPGSTTASLVSAIDIAPTFLELAAVKDIGNSFQGVSFAPVLTDPSKKVRDHAFSEHNWHDFEDHGRSVRTERYKYIKNYYTDVPGTPPADAIRGETFQEMRKLRDAGKLTKEQMNPFVSPRPAEELYDVEADPHELRDLSSDPSYAKVLEELRGVMETWERETEDSVPASRRANGFDRETGEPVGPRPARR